MPGEFDSDSMKAVFSEDQREAYVTNISTGKLPLKSLSAEEGSPRYLDPEDAPLYLDLETGEAIYPSDISSTVATEAARYAIEEAETTTTFRLEQSDERWREEFSELLDQDIELESGGHEEIDAPVDGSPYRYLEQ